MKSYSLDLRQSIIRLVQVGELSLPQIAELFGVSARFVQMLVRRWRETGNVTPRRPGRQRTGGSVPLDKVRRFVAEHPDATLDEIRVGCGLNVHISTICRALQRARLSRKKKVIHASEQDRPDVQQKRHDWTEKTRDIPPNRMIFVDQTGVSTQMYRPYGRAPIGQRVTGAVPENHYQTSTLMGALHYDGQMESIVYQGGTDVAAMLAFIEAQLVPVLKPGDIVIWDNLPTHHTAAVVNAIERTGAQVWNLPPYSPEFNPIEYLWSKVKSVLRALSARTPEALLDSLQKAFSMITTQNVHSWFKHAGYANT